MFVVEKHFINVLKNVFVKLRSIAVFRRIFRVLIIKMLFFALPRVMLFRVIQ